MQIFRTMYDFQEQCQTVVRATMCLSISIFLFKTIIKFGFCDIRFLNRIFYEFLRFFTIFYEYKFKFRA